MLADRRYAKFDHGSYYTFIQDAYRRCILKGLTLQYCHNTTIPATEDSPAVRTTTVIDRQSDWLADMDEEINEQELEAHYNYMAKIQEVPNTDSGTDAKPLEQDDQNDVECDYERVALANLIANLKLDVDENKKIQK
ncbi:hypothetical protein Tco_1274365 [Tanacetum coccineum]